MTVRVRLGQKFKQCHGRRLELPTAQSGLIRTLTVLPVGRARAAEPDPVFGASHFNDAIGQDRDQPGADMHNRKTAERRAVHHPFLIAARNGGLITHRKSLVDDDIENFVVLRSGNHDELRFWASIQARGWVEHHWQ